jgi:DNA-binding response OmpR family regulator
VRILVVEDDPTTSQTVALYLRTEGFEVICRGDGRGALESAADRPPDLVILDLMLPGLDGREVCRRFRAASDVPIIMLTARTAEADRVEGLELGADDYVAKPFSPRELVARARAVLRRRPPAGEAGVLRRGPLVIDLDRHRVTVDGREQHVTASEMTILETLARFPGRVLSRATLVERLTDVGRDALERTIDTHILNLRKKIERDPSDPELIETVVGVGYRLRDVGGALEEGGV